MKNIVIAKPVKAQVWVNTATQIPVDVLLVMEEVTLDLRKMKMSDINYKTGEIADSDKLVSIVVEGGMVVEVNGLPADWQYYIDDRDCPPEIEDE